MGMVRIKRYGMFYGSNLTLQYTFSNLQAIYIGHAFLQNPFFKIHNNGN